MFNKFKINRSVNRVIEDKYYEQVAMEMSQGNINIGTWTRAKANAEGDEKKTEALYIKYRVQTLHDAVHANHVLTEELVKEAKIVNISKKFQAPIPLSKKDLAFAKSAVLEGEFSYFENNANSFTNDNLELLIEYSDLCNEQKIHTYLCKLLKSNVNTLNFD